MRKRPCGWSVGSGLLHGDGINLHRKIAVSVDLSSPGAPRTRKRPPNSPARALRAFACGGLNRGTCYQATHKRSGAAVFGSIGPRISADRHDSTISKATCRHLRYRSLTESRSLKRTPSGRVLPEGGASAAPARGRIRSAPGRLGHHACRQYDRRARCFAVTEQAARAAMSAPLCRLSGSLARS